MAADSINRGDPSGSIILEGRERLSVSSVTDVISFDENEIAADTGEGMLIIGGEDLHVEKLSLDSGELIITGRIDSFEYAGDRKQKGGLWSRLF